MVISENNKELTVTFNETMMISKYWKNKDWDIYVEGPKEPYEVVWNLTNIEKLAVEASNVFVFEIDVQAQVLGFGFENLVVVWE